MRRAEQDKQVADLMTEQAKLFQEKALGSQKVAQETKEKVDKLTSAVRAKQDIFIATGLHQDVRLPSF